MAESAEELYARVSTCEALEVPSFVTWATFPFEVVDGELKVRDLPTPAPEQPREGEGGRPCPVCAPDQFLIWQNDLFRVKPQPQRSGLPLVLLLEPQEHIDMDELDEDQAAELGRLSVRLVRIVESLDGIGRCHIMRTGDGCSHAHLWFLARPARLGATRGTFAPLWDEVLPPGPEAVWRADLATVARKLATHCGEVLI